MFRSSKLFIVLLVLIFASAAFAFAASNTVPSTYAGEGASVTSGYTVSNVVYNLNATTPSNIDSVAFTLNAAATNVKIRLVTTGSYYSCTNSSGFNWSCNTTSPQATVAAANELRVIATE
jgi:archaellin